MSPILHVVILYVFSGNCLWFSMPSSLLWTLMLSSYDNKKLLSQWCLQLLPIDLHHASITKLIFHFHSLSHHHSAPPDSTVANASCFKLDDDGFVSHISIQLIIFSCHCLDHQNITFLNQHCQLIILCLGLCAAITSNV